MNDTAAADGTGGYPGRVRRCLALLVLAIGGCAAEPKPAFDLAESCIEERRQVILRAWLAHESVDGGQVAFPDWRAQAREWAIAECERGHAVGLFYPPDTATARRTW